MAGCRRRLTALTVSMCGIGDASMLAVARLTRLQASISFSWSCATTFFVCICCASHGSSVRCSAKNGSWVTLQVLDLSQNAELGDLGVRAARAAVRADVAQPQRRIAGASYTSFSHQLPADSSYLRAVLCAIHPNMLAGFEDHMQLGTASCIQAAEMRTLDR